MPRSVLLIPEPIEPSLHTSGRCVAGLEAAELRHEGSDLAFEPVLSFDQF